MTMTSRDTARPDASFQASTEALPEVRSDMSHQLRATWVVTRRELLRFKQDRARMVTMLLQPLLFIFVMGTGLGSIVDTGGSLSFRTFLSPACWRPRSSSRPPSPASHWSGTGS